MPERKHVKNDEEARRRHAELGALLRARRAALRPEDVGLPAGRRRHVPGLRREEVAQLAHIGLDWYAALEQGRVTTISPKSLRRVAAILRLDPIDVEHLFSLARDDEPPSATGTDSASVLADLVRAYGDGAAFITDASSSAVAWNAYADELFAFSSRADGDRRMLDLMVREPRMRQVFVNWAETLERMIGVFRATYATNASAALDAYVRDLRAHSPEFERLWRAYTVDAPTAHVCELRSPDGAELHLHFIALRPVDLPRYTVVVLRRI